MLERIRARARELAPEIASWRHHFHAHPELSFEETETTRRVVELLRSFGYENSGSARRGFPPESWPTLIRTNPDGAMR